MNTENEMYNKKNNNNNKKYLFVDIYTLISKFIYL